MLDEIDIYRAAQVLIREHGEDAPLEAARIADQMLERGDVEGLAGTRVRPVLLYC